MNATCPPDRPLAAVTATAAAVTVTVTVAVTAAGATVTAAGATVISSSSSQRPDGNGSSAPFQLGVAFPAELLISNETSCGSWFLSSFSDGEPC